MGRSSPSVPTSRDLLTVDLRGMKAALCDRARAQGVSASEFARQALVREGLSVTRERSDRLDAPASRDERVRVSLRVAAGDALELAEHARVAGRPIGRYVVELMRCGRDVVPAAERRARVAALTRSNAELSTLSRNIAHLTALLKQGAVRAAQEYRQSLDALDGDVRAHLAMASELLSSEPTSKLR